MLESDAQIHEELYGYEDAGALQNPRDYPCDSLTAP